MIHIEPSPPPREVEAVLSHGGALLTLTVQRVAGVRKDGEVRYRRHTTTYAVSRPAPGTVRLVKADGKAVTVTIYSCDCEDSNFKGRERCCKHYSAVVELKLLGAVEAGTPGA